MIGKKSTKAYAQYCARWEYGGIRYARKSAKQGDQRAKELVDYYDHPRSW